jgi:hypothetical protein
MERDSRASRRTHELQLFLLAILMPVHEIRSSLEFSQVIESNRLLERYRVLVQPAFLVFSLQSLRGRFECSTKETLEAAMKRVGVLSSQ